MTLRNIYIYFSFPALVLHELAHLFACILTLTMPSGFRVGLLSGGVRFLVPRSAVVNALINLAPIFNFFVAGFLVAINTYFVFYLIYLILTYKISLPSRVDYDNIRNYGKEEE